MSNVKKPPSREVYRFHFLASQEREYWMKYSSDCTTRKELMERSALEFLSSVAALSSSRAAARRLINSLIDEFQEDVLLLRFPPKKKAPVVKHPENYEPMNYYKKEQ